MQKFFVWATFSLFIILNFSLKPLSLHKLNCISVKQSGKYDVFLLDLHYLAKT